MKKAFHIAFSFMQKMPGVITIPAPSKEEAKAQFLQMADGLNELTVHEIVDLEEVPALNKILQEQLAMEEALVAEEDVEEETKKTVN